MSIVRTRKMSSARVANLQAGISYHLNCASLFTGILLSICSLWRNDATRITGIDTPTAIGAAVCFLIAAYRFGIIRR